MTTAPKNPPTNKGNGATTTELASQLWATANALRGNIDAAEYKHVVLPLMFLKYISDAFEELHEELESKVDEGHDPGATRRVQGKERILGSPGSQVDSNPVPGPTGGQRGHNRPGHGSH